MYSHISILKFIIILFIQHEKTALHLAASSGNRKCVEILLAADVTIDASDKVNLFSLQFGQ